MFYIISIEYVLVFSEKCMYLWHYLEELLGKFIYRTSVNSLNFSVFSLSLFEYYQLLAGNAIIDKFYCLSNTSVSTILPSETTQTSDQIIKVDLLETVNTNQNIMNKNIHHYVRSLYFTCVASLK